MSLWVRHLVIAIVLLGLASPVWAARKTVQKDLYEELDLFAKALHFVREHYVDTPDDQELLYGAIKGMMQSLDPHTVFMPPASYKELQSDTQGRFGGVGIEVTVRDKVLTVIAPIAGTPAARAGLRAGDRILKIDGVSTRHMTLGDAVKLMRGKRGSRVRLVLGRKGRADPLNIALRRDIIHIQSVRGVEMLEGGVGYIHITAFQQDTSNALETALRQLEGNSGGGIGGLILDLRNNPGGLLTEAVAVSDKFLNRGVIVKTRSRVTPTHERSAHSEGTHPNFPIVILVNGGSASAAEIVAGALQDHGRAVVIGTKTFGKGSVQTVYELGRGAAVKLTVARYFTPKGRSIQSKGIRPDIVVKAKKQDVKIEKATNGTSEITEQFEIEVEEDKQKERALDYLRAWIATGKKQPFRKYRG